MNDPANSNVDVATKSSYPMMMNLGQDLNYTYETKWRNFLCEKNKKKKAAKKINCITFG